MPITISADRNIYHLQDWLPDDVTLHTFEPSDGIPDLTDADALVVRTVSKINRHTLHPVSKTLRFVGTASAGTDHIDIDYLERQDIHFASAGGCNARAVAEYIGTSLILWGEHTGLDIHEHTVGIVGVGHVGSALAALFDEMHIEYVSYDPPREIREQSFTSATLDDVLNCDILTFHVPLTVSGQYATRHWLNADKLAGHTYDLVINASRGGVIDEDDLMKAMNQDRVGSSIIDVWENEPAFSSRMSRMALLATPHIAGYSVQAKDNATRMMMEALAKTFELPYDKHDLSGKQESQSITFSEDKTLGSLLTSINPILKYDEELRSIAALPDAERADAFRKLRTDRPFREEYRMFSVDGDVCKRHPELRALGFRCLR